MDRWHDVAAAVRDRRLELGLTQGEIAERAGVSLATWRLIESAGRTRYQPLTVRRMTRSLSWPADAVDRLLEGIDLETLLAEPPHGHPAADDDGPIPVGLARKWRDLSPTEQAKVQGFVDGLLANRRD